MSSPEFPCIVLDQWTYSQVHPGKNNSASHHLSSVRSLEHILEPTYGCIVYQEQVMQIVRDLAGYTLGRSDILRRAMSKKKGDVMERERQAFVYGSDGSDGSSPCCGAVANGVSAETANAILMRSPCLQTMPLTNPMRFPMRTWRIRRHIYKVHYFADDMAALLTSVMGDTTKTMEYLTACQNAGVKVLPPHVNESTAVFAKCGDHIRFGLLAVRTWGVALSRQ